jgi:hypothetical protein
MRRALGLGSVTAIGRGLLLVGVLSQPACSSATAPKPEAVGQSTSALCSSATLAAAPSGSADVGGTVQFTVTPSCAGGDNPQWQLYMLAPGGGGWTLLQDWQPTASAVNWSTTGVATGAYSFEAHIESSLGEASYDTSVDLGYTVNSASNCSAVSGSVSPAGAVAGSPVTISASATCTAGAEAAYRFWVQPMGGTWAIIQDYSSNSSATFVGSDGSASDYYRFEIDTHANGNGNSSYDSWTEVDYNYSGAGSCPSGDSVCNVSVCSDLTSDSANCGSCGKVCPSDSACSGSTCVTSTCGTVTGSASPSPGSTGVGQTVTLAGNATCTSGGAEYRYWVYPPGGAWTMVHDWTASSYSWPTAGLTPGNYTIEIDAKQAGSFGDAESYALFSETLQAASACTSVTASAGPPGQAAGSGVTITALASCSGGGTAEYRYWVMPAGGSWVIFQDYSPSTTANFIGDSTSTYRFEIDTHASGNGNASYDSWTEVDYAYTSPGACPGGDSVCDGSVCADLTSDPAFCGSCSTACASGQTCVSSACK